MKTTKIVSLFALLLVAFSNSLWSADDDIVWKYNVQNFGPGKLLKNDSLIYLVGGNVSVFRNAINGEEIIRYENKNMARPQIYPYNNGNNYVQANGNNNKFYFYETENYTIIDSLEKENKEVFGWHCSSNSGQFIYEFTTDYINVWDILTKNVVRRMNFKIEKTRVQNNVSGALTFDDKYLFLRHSRKYQPDINNPNSVYWTMNYTLHDPITLDSLRNIENGGATFFLSKSNKYIAMLMSDTKNGIDIYDFNTFQKLYTIPCNGKIMSSVNFTSDDKYLIFAQGPDVNKLLIWDIENKNIVYDYGLSGHRVLDISSDDQFIYSCWDPYFIKLKLKSLINTVEEKTIIDTIYPNPTNGKIELKYNVIKPNVFQYEITNLTGQILGRNNLGFKNIGENIETIDVNNLPLGQYNLRLYSENEVVNFKFIRGE